MKAMADQPKVGRTKWHGQPGRKTSGAIYWCILLALVGLMPLPPRARASCDLPPTTHAQNITALTALLPGDARGVLAVDITTLLAGTAAAPVAALLSDTAGDPALRRLFSAIGMLAENIDLTTVMRSALLVQTRDAADGLFLLARLGCDTIGEVTRGPALTPDGTYGTGNHPLYRDLNGNSLTLLPGGVLIAGHKAAVQSALDVADGAAPAGAAAIVPFLSALQSGSAVSFVYGLPAMFNSAITADRSLRGAMLLSGSLDFSCAHVTGSVSFHTANAADFVDNYNDLDSASGDAPLLFEAPIAQGLGRVTVAIPSTLISKSPEELLTSRNTLKKLFPAMQAFDYAEDVFDPGNRPWVDFIIQSEADGRVAGSVFIRWEFKDQAAIDAFEANELPAGFRLAPIRFLESDDGPEYFFMLNIYNAAGPIVSGARAEWDVFVYPADGDTRPRYLCVEALAEAVSADSVNGLTPPQPVSHKLVGNRVVSKVGVKKGDVEKAVFSCAFRRPLLFRKTARFTKEMAIGNDYIYWGNGVLDRGLYNATTFNYDAMFVPIRITRDDTRWQQYIKKRPTDAVYYLNTLEYIVSPWWNLDSPYLDITPEWLQELYDFKNNGNYLTIMREAVHATFRGQDTALLSNTVENTTPAVYYNFRITDPEAMSAALNLPAGYRLAKTSFFENHPAQDYYLTLAVYEIRNAVEGMRAEWRVYVDDGSGREKSMVIDLQTQEAAVDPVSLINLPGRVDHTLTGSTVRTLLSSSTISFEASFDTQGGTAQPPSLDWVEAGDFVCRLNGICDKLFYDAETLDVSVHLPDAVTIHSLATPWNAFIKTTPGPVFYRDNSQEYAVKPWHNLKVAVEEEPFDPIADGTHVITGTGTLVGRTNPAVDSTYTYFGAGTLLGNELYFTIDQFIINALGKSRISTSGSFDLTTGQGTSTVENCTGPALMCAGVDPVLGTPEATSDYTAANLDASDPDCITWDVLFSIDVASFGKADSASSFAAALRANCTDSDKDGWFAEGGCCGAADCDDNDPDVNPGAAEKCNDAKDNNCDNAVNEGCGCLAERLFSRTDPGLKTLRRFRDEILYGSDSGTAFADLYYENSAVLVSLTEDHPALRTFFRGLFEALLPILGKTLSPPE